MPKRPRKGVEAGGMVRETEGIGENGSVRGHGQGVVPIGHDGVCPPTVSCAVRRG